MFFGLIADAQAAADVTRLPDYIRDAFRDLCRAAGIRKPRRRPQPTHLRASAD
jgi:hypothetical protein